MATLPAIEVPFDKDKQLDSSTADSADDTNPQYYSSIDNVNSFLESTLSQSKMDKIYKYLGKAGRRQEYRTLHEQHIYDRKIIITESPCLHLVLKNNTTIFIQPLTPCLTNYSFFKNHILKDEKLYRLACGFLYSYTKLIKFQSDFRIARATGLIPNDWEWKAFEKFRFSLLSHPSLGQNIHRRYNYGELRLGPLNNAFMISTERKGEPYHGCDDVLTEASVIRLAGILAFVFAFNSLILSSMQVALAQPPESCPIAVRRAAFWYAILMLIFLAVAALVLLGYAWIVKSFKSMGGFSDYALEWRDQDAANGHDCGENV